MAGRTATTAGVDDESEAESRTISPEVETFFNLVEREAQRIQLLVRKNDQSEKAPYTRNQVTWQPKFKMEDFSFPLKVPSPAIASSSSVHVAENDCGDGGKEKSLMKLGLKRLRDSLDSSLPEESVKRKNCSED